MSNRVLHDAPDPFVATVLAAVLVAGAVLLANALVALLVCRLCFQ